MTNFIISLGIINKKLFLPFILLLIYILFDFLDYLYKDKNIFIVYIKSFGYSIGMIMIFFINNIIKYKSNSNIRQKRNKKEILKDYFLFFLFFLFNSFYVICFLIPYLIKKNDNEKN